MHTIIHKVINLIGRKMQDQVFFEIIVALPIGDEQNEKINEKLKYKSNHWSDTIPVYFESLEEKYKKVLQNKQVNYRRYDDSFKITVKGFCPINETIDIFKTFEGNIKSYYIDNSFEEKIKNVTKYLGKSME
jgi:hypothetical protein